MIKAEELMIGDWVIVYGTSFGYLKVVKIDSFDGSVLLENDLVISESYGFLQPIPLTKDILERNGFYYMKDVGYVLDDCGYMVTYDEYNHSLRILNNLRPIYDREYFDKVNVHELQHALRLCGVEKEITL